MKRFVLLFLLIAILGFSGAFAQPIGAHRLKTSTILRNNTFKDGADSVAQFQWPARMVSLGDSVILIADQDNHRIRRIHIASRTTSTLAGDGQGRRVDSIGTLASLNRPRDLCLLGDSVLFFTEEGSHSIRKMVLATGKITTLAGGTSGFADGPASAARFSAPMGITIYGDSVLFVADFNNNRIRKIRIKGDIMVSTFAGTGRNNYIARDSLHKDSINIGNPRSVLVVGNRLAFVENDYNHPVLRYIRFGNDTVYNFGSQDRPQDLIQVNGDTVLISSDGGGANILEKVLSNPSYSRSFGGFQADGILKIGNTVYLSQNSTATIFSFQYRPATFPSRFTGLGRFADGDASRVRFGTIGNMTMKGSWIYYFDATPSRIRKFNPTTLETKTLTFGARGNNGNSSKVSLQQARFNEVSDLTFSDDGRLFITDRGNNQIRILDESKDSVFLFSGNTSSGYVNGNLLEARYTNLSSIKLKDGKVFVAELGSGSRIRVIDVQAGTVNTLCGPSPGFSGNGNGTTDSTGAEARFGNDLGGLFFKQDTLLAMDRSNRRIRAINPVNGTVTTYIANNLFDNLPFVFLDKTGALISRYNGGRNDFYLLDKKSAPWTTVLGATGAGNVDGIGTAARFDNPIAAILDTATGNVYIMDRGNQSFRKVEYLLFNQAPVVTGPTPANYQVSNTEPVSVANFLSVSPGPAWESGQTLTPYSITSSNNAIFSEGPNVSATGSLSFTASGTNGVSTIRVCFRDNGGTENNGTDSTCYTFTITANITGIYGLAQVSDLQLFPNPSSEGRIHWTAGGQALPTSFEVQDIRGQKIISEKNSNLNGNISLDKSGIYIIRFFFGDGSSLTRKVAIQ